jgi:hypothetical protein
MQHAKQATGRGRVAVVAAAVALALGAGASLGAQVADKAAQRAEKAKQALSAVRPNPADTRSYVAERNIIKDAATGGFRRPTTDETRKLVEELKTMLSPATTDLQASPVAGGGARIGAQGRFSEVIVARPTADGRMETRCVSSLEAAAEFLGLRQVSGDGPAATGNVAEQ